jgi:hypothetical protein
MTKELKKLAKICQSVMPGRDPGIQGSTPERLLFALSYDPSRRPVIKPDSSGRDPAIQIRPAALYSSINGIASDSRNSAAIPLIA